jgi:hypothetical protein
MQLGPSSVEYTSTSRAAQLAFPMGKRFREVWDGPKNLFVQCFHFSVPIKSSANNGNESFVVSHLAPRPQSIEMFNSGLYGDYKTFPYLDKD